MIVVVIGNNLLDPARASCSRSRMSFGRVISSESLAAVAIGALADDIDISRHRVLLVDGDLPKHQRKFRIMFRAAIELRMWPASMSTLLMKTRCGIS